MQRIIEEWDFDWTLKVANQLESNYSMIMINHEYNDIAAVQLLHSAKLNFILLPGYKDIFIYESKSSDF